ncbi:MAG: enoyl-CoA hydratase/isomerase family protein [Ferruginibacter sp.]|nr:enoyl-CoA hydratase/isomerase family protein [Chitinophagaceae bacterium]MBP6286946.1 enoyl-CoA hydratase/isomerase family protein [Ferruginibacter sp.]MBU9935418.1 enoyl-CoA hydratase/isomerase family protein [Ferruginibacter sp.]
MYSTILTNLENGIFTITINRPDKLNALNASVFTDLDKAVDEINNNPEIRSAIITGAGPKAFIAGADITEFGGLNKEQAMALAKRGQDVFFKIENSKKPIVAAVNGFALGGGCELAMACHFRLCSENAKFGQPEVNLGLIPGYGGTQRLTQLVGKGKSMELQMTAHMVDANEALQLGLVNHVTTAESLLERTKDILTVIRSKAPIAVGKIIECVNVATVSDSAYTNGKSGYDKEMEAFGDCFITEDMKEGTSAFLEKRKANFKGK